MTAAVMCLCVCGGGGGGLALALNLAILDPFLSLAFFVLHICNLRNQFTWKQWTTFF